MMSFSTQSSSSGLLEWWLIATINPNIETGDVLVFPYFGSLSSTTPGIVR